MWHHMAIGMGIIYIFIYIYIYIYRQTILGKIYTIHLPANFWCCLPGVWDFERSSYVPLLDSISGERGIVSIHFSSYTCSLHPHCGESLEVTSPFLPSANQTWIAGKHGKPYLVRRWSVIFFVNLHLARWFIICFPLFKPPFSLMLLPFKNDYYKGFSILTCFLVFESLRFRPSRWWFAQPAQPRQLVTKSAAMLWDLIGSLPVPIWWFSNGKNGGFEWETC